MKESRMTTRIIEEAVIALLRLNNNRDRIRALYEAMSREEGPMGLRKHGEMSLRFVSEEERAKLYEQQDRDDEINGAGHIYDSGGHRINND
jgi:hypothetical protein